MINPMAVFWSGETLNERLESLIEPFVPERIDCAAYTLSIGPEVYVSPNDQAADPTTVTVRKINEGDGFTIPPGQFAFLITEEIVSVPADALAFISKHLGARVGLTAVLHTWGSALTHHPHVHMIVPGGGLSSDDSRWVTCRPGFFLSVRVLSRLFRRLFLDRLMALHKDGRLVFFGDQAGLADRDAFAAHLTPLRKAEWVVYAKRPFGGPEAVLAYLSRYTHRVAISNSRLLACDEGSVTFRWKDYRARGKGAPWLKTMTLAADEFIRRFLIHVLPSGFHRIRHYGLFASGVRAANIARIRALLGAVSPAGDDHPRANDADPPTPPDVPCPCCGGRMVVVEVFGRTMSRRKGTAFRMDTS